MDAIAETERPPLFEIAAFDALIRNPEAEVEGAVAGMPFSARIAIPHYDERIAYHYRDVARGGLAAVCATAKIPFDLPRFGLLLRFARPAELALHDDDMRLDASMRALVARFGPVILRNACLDGAVRPRFHRNIFPHLRFHVDRGPAMPNQYSCFTRDPHDAEQRPPRATSTLFVANIVAWLESVRTGACDPATERGVQASYDLFTGADMSALFDQIVLEQQWSEPDGTGEVAIIDNRSVLHASYHKDGRTPGYRIGARYLE